MHLSLNRSSRSRVLWIGLLVLGAIFTLRLFWLQVIRHEEYLAKAEEVQVTKFTIQPERGLIYAKDGEGTVPLVMNEKVYTAYADPKEVESKDDVVDLIKKVAGGNMVKDFEDNLDDTELRYTVVAKQLNRKQAEMIKEADVAGIGLQESTRRVYPEGSLAAQLLGYVNSEGQGQYGLEEILNSRLAGKPGELKAVTDVRRIPLTIGNRDIRVAANDGDDLVLNVDRNIQAYAEQALKAGLDRSKATKGSVLVLDPNTGQVMAMANYPTYNPAEYNKETDYEKFQNKTVSDPFEAGSVIKTLTMGVGLDTGAVNYNTTFNNTGSIQVDDRVIRNVEEDPINPAATMTDVLHYSLNTGVVHILKQMGGGEVNRQARDKLYEYFANHYLFGKKTGIEQAGEQAGIIIAPDAQEGNNVRYANMTFGQGMDNTMLQVAAAFASAINGGTYYQPQLVAGTMDRNGNYKQNAPKALKTNVLSASTSDTLRKMIYDGRRLGFFGGVDKPGYIVGGKTGTSQVIDPKTGKYSNHDSIGTYVGFGGGEQPEYVIMVRVMDSKAPGYAGTVAAGPIFGDISNWLLDYLNVKPVN